MRTHTHTRARFRPHARARAHAYTRVHTPHTRAHLGHNNQPSHHILHLLLSLDGARAECGAPECDDAHPECLTADRTIMTAGDKSSVRTRARARKRTAHA